MGNFVKPNAILRDKRSDEEKDRALAEQTARNLHHVQKQLVANGHSIEQVIADAAKKAFGVNIHPHAPVPKDEDQEAA